MSAHETGGPGDPGQAPPAAGQGQPTEEEMRAAYEAELSRITTTDMIAQATVSLLNLGARRLGPPPSATGQPEASADAAQAAGRDLEQARDAIDAARALLAILERTIPGELRPLRDALSQLQMAYAREAQAGAETPSPAPAGERPGAAQGAPADRSGQPAGEQPAAGPGPAQASGRLWVPGS